MSADVLFDRSLFGFRAYLSRGHWGRPGLALRLEKLRGLAIVVHAPYIEWADLWVGLYHRKVNYGDGFTAGRDFWLCLLPCIVLKFSLSWPRRRV